MGLETSTGIWDLVETWPLQSDRIRQGAGHFRNFKGAVKLTFPNITAPVTKTAAALNQLPDNFTALLTELLRHVEKKGSIKAHDLANAPIPAGWVICDGHSEPGYGVVPDLRDRFIVGAGLSYSQGNIGGSVSKTTEPGGTHTPVIQGHTLTANEMPGHTHRLHVFLNGANSTVDGVLDAGAAVAGEIGGSKGYITNDGAGSQVIESTGSSQSHSHGADVVPNHQHTVSDVRPPYYAAVYIVKVIDFVMP